MMLKYRYSESTVKPAEFEVTEKTVYIRKDIIENSYISDWGESIVYWTYQEAALTHQEFNEYSRLLMAENAIKGVNDSSNIIQIMTGQEAGDNNQLIIMEAIADLYEMISLMTESK